MTPEERFERIEKTLDRIASEAAARAATNELRFMRIEDAQLKAERGREFLVESHAQLTSDLAQLAKQITETNQAVKETNETVKNLATAVSGIVRLFEDHARDGHGGEGKKEES